MSNKLSNNVFKKKTGIQNIQEYLESGRSITALEALSNFGIFRLASAIEVLRKRGMNIETDTKQDPNGKTYARYSLVASVNEVQPEVVAEEAPKVEFKEGDRVVIKAGVDDTYYKAGDVGTIARVGEYDLHVKFESGHALTVNRNVTAWYVGFEDVELVPAKKELKVGARVRVVAAGNSSFFRNGDEGVVTSLSGDIADVRFDKGYAKTVSEFGSDWFANVRKLEVI